MLQESVTSNSHCLSTKYNPSDSFSSCKPLNHNSTVEPFLKTTVYLPDTEPPKQFSHHHLMPFQETACLSNTLVAPFENMALNATLQPTSICDKQSGPSDTILIHTSSLTHPPPSAVYASLIDAQCESPQAIFTQPSSSQMDTLGCNAAAEHSLPTSKSDVKVNEL